MGDVSHTWCQCNRLASSPPVPSGPNMCHSMVAGILHSAVRVTLGSFFISAVLTPADLGGRVCLLVAQPVNVGKEPSTDESSRLSIEGVQGASRDAEHGSDTSESAVGDLQGVVVLMVAVLLHRAAVVSVASCCGNLQNPPLYALHSDFLRATPEELNAVYSDT